MSNQYIIKRGILVTLIFTLLIIDSSIVYSQTNPIHVWVNSYYRKEVTFVNGHYRTASNYTNRDNFSTKGNINPYTGKYGWIEPDYNITSSNYFTSGFMYGLKSPSAIHYIDEFGRNIIELNNEKHIFELCDDFHDVHFNKNMEYYWYNPTKGLIITNGKPIDKVSMTLLNGESIYINSSNDTVSIFRFYKGLLHGDCVQYERSGNTMPFEMHFVMGIMDYAKFQDENGYTYELIGELNKPSSDVYMRNELDTTLMIYHVIDSMKSVTFTYYDNGNTKSLYMKKLDDEIYYGNYITFYEDGKKEFYGKFNDDGFRIDTWFWWNEDGSVINYESYRTNQEYWKNGEIKCKGAEIQVDEDEWLKHDRWIMYNRYGDYKKTIYYKGGIKCIEF